MTKGGSIILRIYFALVSLITLVILIFSVSDAINIGLRTWVFPSADQADVYLTYECDPMRVKPLVPASEMDPQLKAFDSLSKEEQDARCEKVRAAESERNAARKQRDLVRDLALLIVSLPLFIVHFRIVYRDWHDERKAPTPVA